MEKDLEMNFKDYMSIYEITVEKFKNSPNNEYFINKLKEAIQQLPTECKITKIDLKSLIQGLYVANPVDFYRTKC